MSLEAIVRQRLPAAALRGLGRGVMRAMCTHEGRLVDARVSGAPPQIELVTPPEPDPERLELWISLMARRRSQLAHDLSSPATGVLAALETVLEYERVEDSTRELLDEARRGLLRLNGLLETRDGLLGARVNAVEGRLDDLVRRGAAELGRAIDPEEERLSIEVLAPSQHVRVDASALRSAIVTFVGNTWRYRRGQRVHARILADAEDDWIRLAVEDEGQGLTPEALRRAGELGFSTRSSGVGMGLTVLRFVLRDRGAVVLTPKDPGCRAEVFLRSSTS